MPITTQQMNILLKLIATAEPDGLDCDGCLARVSEYAETELASLEIPEAMRAVEVHLKQCPCCED